MGGIAIIGAGMIAGAHAMGYRTFLPRVPGLDATLDVICDANQDLAEKVARTWGFSRTESSWQSVLDDMSIRIVSVCLPNFLHTEVTQAALMAGKHVLCEKPLAITAQEARATRNISLGTDAASGTVLNYRRIPAVADIAQRVKSGELGDPLQIIVLFQCDYAADPLLPHSWRYEFDKAGPGALLDLGTHAADLARFIFGEVSEIVGATSTISIKERYLPAGAATGHAHVALSDRTALVDNDDIMSALLRFTNGAQGYLSASRVAVGTGNRVHVEVFGTKGTARFSTEMPSHFELAIFDSNGLASFRRMINRPSSPAVAALAAVPHELVSVGYAESFGFLIHEFLTAVAEGRPFENGSITDGYRAAQILDAIQRASVENRPVPVEWDD